MRPIKNFDKYLLHVHKPSAPPPTYLMYGPLVVLILKLLFIYLAYYLALYLFVYLLMYFILLLLFYG